jgi:hypothetical protein
MEDRIKSDIFSIFLAIGLYLSIFFSHIADLITLLTIYLGVSLLLITNITSIIIQLNRGSTNRRIDIFGMVVCLLIPIYLMFGEFSVPLGIAIPIFYYFLPSFLTISIIFQTMGKIEHSVALFFTIPLLFTVLMAQFIVVIIDLMFPPKLQKLVPYIDVTKIMILSFSQIMASPERKETEKALNSLGDVSGMLDEISEGYAMRKSVGQGIDMGLTFIVFISFGVLTVLTEWGIPPAVIAALFASLGLALSTFAGFFGPFYGLAGACKDFSLRTGNYRGASIYKAIEQIFAIPFMAASAGFLFLDLPPIDQDTLEDFKDDMQEQLTEISDNVSSLLGTDKSAVPRKTQKLIKNLMNNTTDSISKLDFRQIRLETTRQFALTYYQHEFSWKPWKRKSAVRDFAEQHHYTLLEGEETLQLIGYKIVAGQMQDDMVNNVMVSAALKGIIMMEQKYQELFEDAELGQIATGLAFGGRQFLKDHFVVRERNQIILMTIKNFFLGIFAIPIVLILSFHNYANRTFDVIIEEVSENIIVMRSWDFIKLRFREINTELIALPDKMREKREKKKKDKTKVEKTQRNWAIRRKTKRLFSMIWEVVIFPFMIIWNIFKWIYKKFTPSVQLEEAVSHAALVAMYNQLYDHLVLQTHVSSQ